MRHHARNPVPVPRRPAARGRCRWRPVPCAGLLLLGWAVGAPAQEPAAAPALPVGSLAIVSQPAGVGVRLVGEQVIEGRTPLVLSRGLAGRYRVMGMQDGYETWRRTIYLDGLSADSLFMKLSAKQALRAGARSALLPGWGQFYSGRPASGWAYLLLGLSAGTLLAVEEFVYQDRVDDYETAREAYRAAATAQEVQLAYEAYRTAARRAEDAFENRRRAAYAAAGVWGINLLDSIVLFRGPGQGSWTIGGGVKPAPGGGEPALALRRTF